MKKSSLILVLSFICPILFAQKDIDLGDALRGKYRVGSMSSLSWQPIGEGFAYVLSLSPDSLMFREAGKVGPRCLLTTARLRQLFPSRDIRRLPAFSWVDSSTFYFPALQAWIDTRGNLRDTLPLSGINIISANLKEKIFVTKENAHVFVRGAKNHFQPVLLCPDTGKNIVFGEAVHRNEWGINEGQYISKSGKYIAFYRMDESEVEDYPLVNTSTPIATVKMIKYPMAGRASHTVKVGIFDVEQSLTQNKPVYYYVQTRLEDGEYLTHLTFSPDEETLYISHLNRAQDHLRLVAYRTGTGERIRQVLEEHDSCYIEPQGDMLFLKNNCFIWQSDRDGYSRSYLYDLSGRQIKEITPEKWNVRAIGVDPREEYLYFSSNTLEPCGNHYYKIRLKDGKNVALTPENGTHQVLFSDNYQFFIDYLSRVDLPLQITLTTAERLKQEILFTAENPYKGISLGTTKIFPIKNVEQDDLWCRLILPPDFDSTFRYPVFLYVYGGPHSQLVTNTFLSGGVFLQYMAQQGYLVFTLDNRGTANRGAAFEKCIHRNLGVKEVEDQMQGVHFLKRLPYVDSTRIGVDGWSYGGFMTLSLITAQPRMFKAASCGGPVVNWEWYEVMYGERYMDTPKENPEGYARANILNKVKNIQIPLLVMHGAQDHTVMWQNSLELLQKAVEEQVQLDYFVYPAHDHNVIGIEREHLWNKIFRFHEEHTKK
jgi:dipeptidyl-peptidase-4